MKKILISIHSIIDQKITEYTFEKELITIGRIDTNDIVLNHKHISSKHATIEWKDDAYWINDQQSQLGILDHQQNQVKTLQIIEGLEVIIGIFEFKFSFQEKEKIQKLMTPPPSIMISPVEKQKPPVITKTTHDVQSFKAIKTTMDVPKSVHQPVAKKTLFQTLFSTQQSKSKTKFKLDEDLAQKSKLNINFKWKAPLDLYRQKTGIVIVFSALILSMIAFLYLSSQAPIVSSTSIKHQSEKYMATLQAKNMEANCENCHAHNSSMIESNRCMKCHENTNDLYFHQKHLQASQDELFTLKSQSQALLGTVSEINFLKNIEIDTKKQIVLNCVACHTEHKEDLSNHSTLVDSEKCMKCHPDRSNLLEKKTISFFQNRHEKLQKDTKLPIGIESQKVNKAIGLKISDHLDFVHKAHENISGQCAGCHANESRDAPQKNIAGQCFRCHIPNQSDFKENFDASQHLNQTQCVDCHHYSTDLIAKIKKIKNDQHQSKVKKQVSSSKKTQFKLNTNDVEFLKKMEKVETFNSVELSIMIGIFLILFSLSNIDKPTVVFSEDDDVKEIKPKKIIHILDDPCVGCGECVSACPFDVLALYKNSQGKKVAKVINFDSCNECDACVKACKPEALTRRMPHEPLPMISRPELDSYYMTSLEGVYLIGEASGKSLIRNANNLGSKVIQHMLHSGLTANSCQSVGIDLDVLIIGAGPAGLSAGICAQQAGLKHLVIEKSNQTLSILRDVYPAGKDIQNQPINVNQIGPLPMNDWEIMSKEDFLKACDQMMRNYPVQIKFGEEVKSLKALENTNAFVVETSKGRYTTQRIVIAMGTRGNPTKLGCEGENSPHVKYHLPDPKVHQNQDLIIVGGGNSALEAAVALAKTNHFSNRVSIIHRGANFNKASEKNVSDLENLEKSGKIKVYRETNIVKIEQDQIVLKSGNQTQFTLGCQAIYCMLGAKAPNEWLKNQGIKYVDKPQGWSPSASDDVSFF